MFHHKPKSGILLALACLISLHGGIISVAQAQHAYPTTGHSLNLTPPSPTSDKEVFKAVKSGLQVYDATELGDRTPLILVHGIGGTENRHFNWAHFLTYTHKKSDFQKKYKIYLYHYDSTRSVPDISKNLQVILKKFVHSLDGRKIKILAYSEGGLLVRNVLQDKYLDDQTEEVLTIATPFHGSPLANPEWLQQQVKTESAFSLVRMGQKIAYKITKRMYPTFKQDFHWDNFDGAIPQDQYLKSNGPIVQTDYALAKKRNFVTYGSYFGLEVDPAVLPRELGLTGTLPKERLMPGNLLRRNFLFSLVRHNIGKLPLAKLIPPVLSPEKRNTPALSGNTANSLVLDTAKPVVDSNKLAALDEMVTADIPADSLKQTLIKSTMVPIAKTTITSSIQSDTQKIVLEPVSMMMYNDGISPISSTLWLGRFNTGSNGAAMPVEHLWSALKALKGNKNARLFAGLDHRNWMDGTTRTGEPLIRDLLNPDEPPRPIFEWIVYDLMS